jgi:4-hydroxy-2-oxoheptanedioate aldolase
MVRKNRTKEKLSAGGVAFGVTVGADEPANLELAGLLGFDYAIIDCEHDLFNERELEESIRAADVNGLTAIARMQNNPELILHALDGGAQGVLVARVNTAQDAQAVVDAAKFRPEGKRTIFFRSRGGGFGLNLSSARQWTLDINSETMIGFIMEEITAVNNLADILATPGLDFIDLGPLDLAHSMDWPDQALVGSHVQKIINDSITAGKTVNSGANVDNLADILDRGFRMITVSPREFFQSGGARFLAHAGEVLQSKGLA